MASSSNARNQFITPQLPRPSRESSLGTTSDRDASMEPEEESADESDFLDADGLDDNPSNSTNSLSRLVPAMATSSARSSSTTPWPYTSLTQSTPTTSSQVQLDFPPPPPIPASSLPHEILLHILRLLPSPSLSTALLVCKAWCQCGVELLWHKPVFTSLTSLWRMLKVVANEEQTFPYPSFIRRLNFSALHADLTDKTLQKLVRCDRLERLTLAGCNQLSEGALTDLISACPQLVALDLSDVTDAGNVLLITVAKCCPRLQGLNLSGCKYVSDGGIEAIANSCRGLRRIKLRNVELLTDKAVIVLSINCPLLLELDLVSCPLISSLSLLQLFRTSNHLRELSLQSCSEITDVAFPETSPSAGSANSSQNNEASELEDQKPLILTDGTTIPRPQPLRYPPAIRTFDHLRFLDLTSLNAITDTAVAGIVKYMPRIRNLILAKCSRLTDESVLSICHLGKHLHYLHLGHVVAITDRAVTRLARSCTRLRYIDLANCNLLTDMSVFELAANLPRLKRIGLVKVINITDEAIFALFARTSLERIHLSYCENVTRTAIHELLQHLPRLTHLSLTGVPSFRRADLQMWCRTPPREFNTHQRQAFCVYSGKGVQQLRQYLKQTHWRPGDNSGSEGEGRVINSNIGEAGAETIARHHRGQGTVESDVLPQGRQVRDGALSQPWLHGTGPGSAPGGQGRTVFRPIPIDYIPPGANRSQGVDTYRAARLSPGAADARLQPSRSSAPPILTSPLHLLHESMSGDDGTNLASNRDMPLPGTSRNAGNIVTTTLPSANADNSGWTWDPIRNVGSFVNSPSQQIAPVAYLTPEGRTNGADSSSHGTGAAAAEHVNSTSQQGNLGRPRGATLTRTNFRYQNGNSSHNTSHEMSDDGDSDRDRSADDLLGEDVEMS